MNNPQLSKGNHFKFGYNGLINNHRLSAEDVWWADYGACQAPSNSFYNECLNNARQIRQDANSKIAVLFSGGIDSEVALLSFYLAKIPVTAAILKFKNGFNDHDTVFAIKTCESLQIPYYVFELDVLSFWENDLFNYADPTFCVSPQFLTTMWLSDQLEEFPVIGSGDCNFVKSYAKDSLRPDWFLWEKEKVASWYRHFQIRKRNASPAFFQYTPEILESFLNDGMVQKILKNELPTHHSVSEHKLKIYQQHFKLVDRPKYTGFENILKYDHHFRAILEGKFGNWNSVYRINVHDFQKKLASSSIEDRVHEGF